MRAKKETRGRLEKVLEAAEWVQKEGASHREKDGLELRFDNGGPSCTCARHVVGSLFVFPRISCCFKSFKNEEGDKGQAGEGVWSCYAAEEV